MKLNSFFNLIILIIAIIFITINLTLNLQACPKQEIIYRYIPRTFEEEQNSPVLPSEIFKTLFSQQSPWIGSINELDTRNMEAINKYFISQS
jgi:hypothetical protein